MSDYYLHGTTVFTRDASDPRSVFDAHTGALLSDTEIYYRRNAHIDRLGNLFRLYGYGIYSIEGYDAQSIWRIMSFDAEENMDHTIVVSGCWGWSIEEWIKAIKKKL